MYGLRYNCDIKRVHITLSMLSLSRIRGMPMRIHLPGFTSKNIFTLLGLVALFLVIILNKNVLKDCLHLLGQFRWYVVILVVIIQFLSYLMNAFFYRAILNVFSLKQISLRKLFEGALATNYVNFMVPSIGAAGAGYLSQVLSPEVNRGEAVLSQIMRLALNALSLLIMMPIGLLLIITSRQPRGSIVSESLISTAIILGVAVALFWLIDHESILRTLARKLIRNITRLYPRFHGERAIMRFLHNFYEGYRSMLQKKKQMRAPFAWSLLYVTIELLTVFVIFLGFGEIVNPGIIIIAYLIANIVSIFGGVLFSIGAFELGMAGTFITLGIAPSLALSVTVVYRSLNLLISLPPGFYYYRKYLP